jgi:hypothetical protein
MSAAAIIEPTSVTPRLSIDGSAPKPSHRAMKKPQ